MASHQITILANGLESRDTVTIGFESTLFAIVTCIALVGNVFVCCAIWRNSRLRKNISNIFVFALALSDILIAAICMPFSLGTLVTGKWLFGNSFCQLQGFCILTFAMISLHTMGLISLNRYFCIVKRSKYRQLFKKRRTLCYIMIVWFNAVLGSVPPFFLTVGGYAFQPGKAICLYTFEANVPYTIFIETVYIGFPFVLISKCYSAVFVEVYRSNKVFVPSQQSIQEMRTHVQEAKVSKTLAVVILAFVVCWIPISIIDIIDAINGHPYLKREVYLMYTSLAFISSSVNPFIYGIVSRTFLYEYKQMFKQVVCWKFWFCQPHVVEPFISDFNSPAEDRRDGINDSNIRNDAENAIQLNKRVVTV